MQPNVRRVRWDVIAAYAASVRAVRLKREAPAEPGAAEVGWEQVAAYRQRVSHLDARLAPGAFDEAAYGGLQDTQPRAALMALHTRVADIGPASWERPVPGPESGCAGRITSCRAPP